jgi:hypothetical protein
LTFSSGGLWQVDGDGLESAAAKAEQDRATAGLGDRSAEVVAFVGTHADGVSAGKVEAQFGEDARRYLARLAKSGRIRRVAYGVYAPVSQVSQCPTLDEELGQRDTWDTHLGDNKP